MRSILDRYLYPSLRFLRRRVIHPLNDQQASSRLIRFTARRQWKLLVINLISNFAIALTEGATFGVIFLAVDWLTHPDRRLSFLNWGLTDWLNGISAPLLFVSLMMIALCLQICQSLASYVNRISMEFFAARCHALISERIHSQILSLSFPCASLYRVGDLSDQISKGPYSVSIQISMLNELIIGGLLGFIYLIILFRLSPWLMLTALFLGGIIAFIQKLLLPRIRQAARRTADVNVEVSSRIIENIQGLRLLHTTGQLGEAEDRLKPLLKNLQSSLRRRAALIGIIDPLSKLLPVFAFTLIASLSIVVFNGRSAGVLPSLVTFMLALQRFNVRFAGIATSFNTLSDNTGRLNRLNRILTSDDKEFRRVGGVPFSHLNDEILFDHVSLRYASDLPFALDNVSFTLPKGSTLALVGSSGAGKSSIADLLVGLFTPTMGRILIDDTDLSTIRLDSWQQRLGVVSQDTYLFNTTLAENIAYGCPWVTEADVRRAVDFAQASGFVADLPDGLNTLVGERGYRLSGGQRQRISLARALLREPELLILDEATSALDSESERLVQQAIESFDGSRTVLVIAHRLSTIMNADMILVLEGGRVIERGLHEQLLHSDGRYSRLWQQQTSGTAALDHHLT